MCPNLRINKLSIVYKNIINYKHSYDYQNTRMLHVDTRHYSIIISEIIYIKSQINVQTETMKRNKSYDPLLYILFESF